MKLGHNSKYLAFLFIFLLACQDGFTQNNTSENLNCPPQTQIIMPGSGIITDGVLQTELAHANRRLQRIADRTRNASVEVDNFERRIRGSGTYYTYNDQHIIITAAHVVRGDSTIMRVMTQSGESMLARIILFNMTEYNDLAVLLLDKPLESRVPMDLEVRDIVTCCAEDLIGEPTVYTGSPGNHEQLTIFGIVSGYADNNNILLHSYAWAGASGSNIFDNRGRLIGVLKATDMNQTRVAPYPQITEDIVWVSPGSGLDLDRLETILEIYKFINESE